MGYTTNFTGEWKLNKPLTPEHKAYLQKFSNTRRVKRDPALTAKRDDPIRAAVGLPVGVEGGYFVGAGGEFGQEGFGFVFGDSTVTKQATLGILDDNEPPEGQPGLWCKWEPNDDGTTIRWSGAEKFYEYTAWITYLLDHFLTPWGYILSGKVKWKGEDSSDKGYICISNNKVFVNQEPTALDQIVEAVNAPPKAKKRRG